MSGATSGSRPAAADESQIGVIEMAPDGQPELVLSDGPHFTRQDEPATLGVVQFTLEGCRAPVAFVRRSTQRWRCTQPDEPGPRWYAWRAIAADYDNSEGCLSGERCPDPIRYERWELVSARGRWQVQDDVLPLLSSPGTHRIEPSTAALPEGEITPPCEQILGRFELVVRRDDTYVGYLTELLGTPFIFWPVEVDGCGHQTDRRLGADCVAMVIYGRRRLGDRLPYLAPPALERFTEEVAVSSAEVILIERGDVLDFGFQTAVLAEDTEPLGILDATDVIIHSYHERVEERPFGELPYGASRFVVRRW